MHRHRRKGPCDAKWDTQRFPRLWQQEPAPSARFPVCNRKGFKQTLGTPDAPKQSTDDEVQKGKSRQAEAFSDEFSDSPYDSNKRAIAANYSPEITYKYPREDSNRSAKNLRLRRPTIVPSFLRDTNDVNAAWFLP